MFWKLFKKFFVISFHAMFVRYMIENLKNIFTYSTLLRNLYGDKEILFM